jgi:hypothetical protein
VDAAGCQSLRVELHANARFLLTADTSGPTPDICDMAKL